LNHIENGVEAVLPATHEMNLVRDGRGAAWQTVRLMRRTRGRMDPLELVETYAESFASGKKKEVDDLWQKYGDRTIDTMIDGCRTLAMLWDSAWKEGHGREVAESDRERDEDTLLTTICDDDADFFVSTGLDAIDDVLTK
ncbi:MAG: hypothetical protein ACXW31_13835, partial [Thermoanaerobaculia bacterium]